MNEIVEKFDVGESFYIYLQRNSKVWLARFKSSGRWISRTTKQRDRASARDAAIGIKAECDFKVKHGISVQTKAFKDVASMAITRMKELPKSAKGQSSFVDYIRILNRYHIPYFDRVHITSIDYERLAAFDAWREIEMGHTPAQSTLKSHNAAMQRVFDEAVTRRWMTTTQIPELTVAGGTTAQRRDYFTQKEVEKIRAAFPAWIDDSRKAVTRDIRLLLFFYFNIAVHTGLRPGTEMDNLLWSDIKIVPESSEQDEHVVITVRKGKTTLHTGSRFAVGHKNVAEMILDMHSRSEDGMDTEEGVPADYDPLLFRLPDGSTTDQLGRNFSVLLKQLGLEKTAGGKRTLYSLRHTYITHMLLDKVPPSVIAKQCGTSSAMIEMHYSHITPLMHVKELLGSETAGLTKLINKYADLA
jgi:integrase